MLVRGTALEKDELVELADFITSLRPETAYLAVPTRPPAEPWAVLPEAGVIAFAREMLEQRMWRVDLLAPEPSANVIPVLDPAADLEGILAVHPMREHEVRAYLASAGVRFGTVEELIASGRVRRARHDGDVFYTRSEGASRRPSGSDHR
jgi:wyosine [tRNA(Phe)-imidazoG37] synthetase (radical SAM superfamily)